MCGRLLHDGCAMSSSSDGQGTLPRGEAPQPSHQNYTPTTPNQTPNPGQMEATLSGNYKTQAVRGLTPRCLGVDGNRGEGLGPGY